MTDTQITRVPGMASRGRDRGGDNPARRGRVTVEMIGIKWHATRHGDLRARLREAVERDGFNSAADWLADALARREMELSPTRSAHPLAG
jgi:hypothetical protein